MSNGSFKGIMSVINIDCLTYGWVYLVNVYSINMIKTNIFSFFISYSFSIVFCTPWSSF